MMNMMSIFMVFIMGSFVYGTQSAIGLYIVTTTVFSVVQYAIQYRVLLKAELNGIISKRTKKPQIISK
jgi:membrane protein insertase Oxa1/YidC/SpoIIIJ